jgi:hypothetical protein
VKDDTVRSVHGLGDIPELAGMLVVQRDEHVHPALLPQAGYEHDDFVRRGKRRHDPEQPAAAPKVELVELEVQPASYPTRRPAAARSPRPRRRAPAPPPRAGAAAPRSR